MHITYKAILVCGGEGQAGSFRDEGGILFLKCRLIYSGFFFSFSLKIHHAVHFSVIVLKFNKMVFLKNEAYLDMERSLIHMESEKKKKKQVEECAVCDSVCL